MIKHERDGAHAARDPLRDALHEAAAAGVGRLLALAAAVDVPVVRVVAHRVFCSRRRQRPPSAPSVAGVGAKYRRDVGAKRRERAQGWAGGPPFVARTGGGAAASIVSMVRRALAAAVLAVALASPALAASSAPNLVKLLAGPIASARAHGAKVLVPSTIETHVPHLYGSGELLRTATTSSSARRPTATTPTSASSPSSPPPPASRSRARRSRSRTGCAGASRRARAAPRATPARSAGTSTGCGTRSSTSAAAASSSPSPTRRSPPGRAERSDARRRGASGAWAGPRYDPSPHGPPRARHLHARRGARDPAPPRAPRSRT